MFLAAAGAVLSAAAFGRADEVVIPPVTIVALPTVRAYQPGDGETVEFAAVQMDDDPASFTGGGAFAASIGTGDTVVLRVEAPPGQQFRIRHRSPHVYQIFTVSVFFQAGNSDGYVPAQDAVVRFENGVGTTPVPDVVQAFVSDNGYRIDVYAEYAVGGDFTFTAYEVRITIAGPLADVPRNYQAVGSNDSFVFGVHGRIPGNHVLPAMMVIEPQVGACCVGGVCTIVASTACAGEFLGANSACSAPGRGGKVFNACCPADFDGVPGLGVPDIFAYLSAWFAGCP